MTLWTSPKTWSVAEKVTAALMNTHLRDNLNYLAEVIAGVNTDKIPGAAFGTLTQLLGKGLEIRGSQTGSLLIDRTGAVGARFSMFIGDGTAIAGLTTLADEVYFHTKNTDYHWTNDASGTATEVLKLVSSTGKFTGKAFWSSSQITLAAGASTTVSHGLGARPRFISINSHTASTTEDGTSEPGVIWGGAPVATMTKPVITGLDNTTVYITNKDSVTRYIFIAAMK